MKIHNLANRLVSRSLRGALGIGVTALLGFYACSGSDTPAGAPAAPVNSLALDVASVRSLPIQVRDSETGLGLQAAVAVRQQATGALLAVRQVSAATSPQIEVPRGATQLSISAPGHQSLDTYLAEGELLPTTVLLDPEAPAAEMLRETVLSQVKEGFAMLHGHVANATSGTPIEGATVRLLNGGQSTQTDARGYFTLHTPIAKTAPDELPAAESLIVEKVNYQSHTLSRTLLAAGATHFAIDLVPGVGKTGSDDTHKIVQAEAGPMPDVLPPPAADVQAADAQAVTTPAAGLVAVPLKASIRVGTSCSCTTCSAVSVLSAETYVKRGLNDEWIASWDIDSLRAGAVAYRSYGQWYAYHPLKSTYDICSSTCCQVNDSDTHTNSDKAATDTASVVVQKSSAVFRSEYAAENNGNSCANGYTGSPSASWPCMADSTCKGTTFNGHGRGMCQWGTQRWATTGGKDWLWIVNHYYNNNGSPSGERSAYLGNR